MSSMNWQRRRDPFRDLQREMGRLLETIEPWPAWRAPRALPPLNLSDAGDHYLLTAQLPGMDPADLDLSITGETLTMRGERRRPEGVGDESYRRQERPFGRWSRTVTLPDRVDGASVSASFEHGILSVTLPKAEESRPRQIAVTTPASEPRAPREEGPAR